MPIIQSGMPLTPALLSTQSGTVAVSFTALTTFSVNVVFPQIFASQPRLTPPNINSVAAPTLGWTTRAINVTTTGFTIRLDGPSATWAGVNVVWYAFPI